MPDGCSGDVNNNGTSAKCLNSSCIAGVVSSATTGKSVAESGANNHSSSTKNILSLGGNECSAPRRVQVTAKVLFGSINAISDMKQNEKLQKKRPK
ncbi:hypothetical protein V9T40_012242 [Parthenolecanium corni]|uniref:Uncharacterized protein n=1 Tax=Parthenolecanium corni TaxID=536013 RepID=A0AAN9XYX3_9HEMI